MKEFTIEARALKSLWRNIASMKPKEVAEVFKDKPIKAIHMKEKLCKDLDEANKEYNEGFKIRMGQAKEIADDLKKEKERIDADESVKDKNEAKMKALEIAEKKNDSLEEADAEHVKEIGDVKVSLSDDKHDFLLSIFPKTVERWTSTDMFVKVADALGIED